MLRWTLALVSLSVALPAHAGEATVKIVTLGDSITRGVRTGVKAEETRKAGQAYK